MWGDIGFFGWVEKEGRVVVGANGFFDFQKNTCAPSCGGGRTPLAVPPGQTDSLREGSHCRLAATGAATRAQLHAYPGGGSLRGLPPSVNPSGNNIHTHTPCRDLATDLVRGSARPLLVLDCQAPLLLGCVPHRDVSPFSYDLSLIHI